MIKVTYGILAIINLIIAVIYLIGGDNLHANTNLLLAILFSISYHAEDK